MARAAKVPVSNDVLLERLNNLVSDIGDIKASQAETNKLFATFRQEYIKEHQIVVGQAEGAHKRLDKVEKDVERQTEAIKSLQDAVKPLIFANKILAWLAGVLGVSIVTLIWMIIIGQVQVIMP